MEQYNELDKDKTKQMKAQSICREWFYQGKIQTITVGGI